MIQHSVWAEKYRSQKPSEFISTPEIISKVEGYILKNDIPHLLLAGQVGSGKTTLAKLLVKNLDCDYIFINASDENGVDTIRDKVKSFASSASFRPLKVIILDEADYLTTAAQATLRNIIETFSKTTRFIFTCNYFERIIEPIHSRCTRLNLIPPVKSVIAGRIGEILDNEKIKWDAKDVVDIINKLYPDIRSIINKVQESSASGELVLPKSLSLRYQQDILALLKTKKQRKDIWKEIRQIIADNDVREFEELYRRLYEFYLEDPEKIIIIGEWQYKHSLVPDKEINFASCVLKLLE